MGLIKLIFIIVTICVVLGLVLNGPIKIEKDFEISEYLGELENKPIIWKHNVTKIKETNLLEIMGWKK